VQILNGQMAEQGPPGELLCVQTMMSGGCLEYSFVPHIELVLPCCCVCRFDGVTSMMYHHHGLSYAFTGQYDE
jgi:hypothetical protein